MAGDARGRALPRLHLGDRGHQHGPRPSRGSSRPSRRRPRSCSTGSRTSSTTSRGSGCTSASPGCSRTARGPAFLANSGAEAVEAAVKLARVATGRPAIIAFRYGFHGRTAQAMALTAAKDVYRGAFEPLPGSIYHTVVPVLLPGRRAARTTRRPAPATGRRSWTCCSTSSCSRTRSRRSSWSPSSARAATSCRRPTFLPRLREITREHGILLDRRRGPDRLRPDRRAVRGPPLGRRARTSSSWPRASRRGCRCRGSSPGRSSWTACRPGSHGGTYGGNVVVVRGGHRDARRHRGRGAGRERARARRAVPRRAPARSRRGTRRSGTSAASA